MNEPLTPPDAARPSPFVFPGVCRRVIDGDTLEADIDRGWNDWTHGARVRLIDCWAPESYGAKKTPEGRDAKAFMETLVKPGDRLLIASRVKVDAFGRVLADVWVGESPRTLNEIMVKTGHATTTKHALETQPAEPASTPAMQPACEPIGAIEPNRPPQP